MGVVGCRAGPVRETGDESVARPFIQLGLGADLMNGKLRTAEDVFKAVEGQFRLIPDTALRSKAAFDLFGAGAKELLPVFSKNKDDLEALRREAEKFGETKRSDLELEKTTKLLEDKNRLMLAIDDLKDAAGSAFFKVLAEGAGNLAATLNDNKEKITDWIESAAQGFKGVKDDIGKLFTAPLETKRLDVTVDGKSINMTKDRLRELLEAAKTTQAGVAAAEAGDDEDEDAPRPGGAARSAPRFRVGQPFTDDVRKPDGSKGPGRVDPKFRFGYPIPQGDDDPEVKTAKTRAANLATISLTELRNYVAYSHAKILIDKEANQSYVLIQGQRVDITKANAQIILKGLADDVQKQINLQQSGATQQIKFANEWFRSLYGPAQELRRLGLDVWDAITGKGFGDRSITIQKISSAWRAATGYAAQFRDAVLGLFGVTVADLPTMAQLWDKVLAAFDSFKRGLFSQAGAAEIPWAAAVGKGVAYLGEVLNSAWTIAVSVFSALQPYISAALKGIGDAFRATADLIRGNKIGDENAFAWVQPLVPIVEGAFAKVRQIVTDAYEYVKAKLADWFKDVTLDDVKAAFGNAFDWIKAKAAVLYEAFRDAALKVIQQIETVLPWLDKLAQLIGYKDFEDFAFKSFIASLITSLPFLSSFNGIMMKLVLVALPVIFALLFVIGGAIVGLVGLFGGIPVAIGAALVAIVGVAYAYSDKIKAALGGAADWVVDKWKKVKGLIGGVLTSVKKAIGLGGGDEPASAGADGAATPAAGPGIPASAGGPDVVNPDGSVTTTIKGPIYDIPNQGLQILTPDAKPAGPSPNLHTLLEGMKQALQGLPAGLSQQTPFSGAPPVVPEGKGGANLQRIDLNLDPNDTSLFGTPAAAENLIKQLQQAGISVSTPRPRAQ